MNFLLHLCTADAWAEAQTRGEYRPGSLMTEGFIHCSTPAQVVKTANRFYRGQTNLVLLVIDPARVTAEIKYEPADADLFPHLYGPLGLDAVVRTGDFAPDADGYFGGWEFVTVKGCNGLSGTLDTDS